MKNTRIKLANLITEKSNPSAIDIIVGHFKRLGVKYELMPKGQDAVSSFKVIWKPINKSDSWYDKFEDVIDRYNLHRSVKQSR